MNITVHVIVPDGIDDPARPSGGNIYDRRVCDGLVAGGWDVCEHPVAGSWPTPDVAARDVLRATVGGIPDGALVLVDGLVGSASPEVLVPQSERLTLIVLVHMPLETPAEGEVLAAATAIVTTSHSTRDRLLERYPLRADAVTVAHPGTDPAEVAPGSSTGGLLMCVAAVTPNKGHDVLLAALGAIADLTWRCVCVGSLDLAPTYVDELRRQAAEAGIADRVDFVGAKTGAELAAAYAAGDVLVLASRAETYGMVVAESLARGLPVIATAVGGVAEALGSTADGLPGLLVPPDDAAALAGALRSWLGDAAVRRRLRQAAGERRDSLTRWSSTVERVTRVLDEAGAVRR